MAWIAPGPEGSYRVELLPGAQEHRYRITRLTDGVARVFASVSDLLSAIDRELKGLEELAPAEQTEDAGTGAVGPTFVVRVLFQQNATWQGSIQWIEGRQTRQFRSALEMLKLMDDAAQMQQSGQQDDSRW